MTTHYEVVSAGHVEAYDRDVLMPVPRLRLEREGECLWAVDALLSGQSARAILRETRDDLSGNDLCTALGRFVALAVEDAILEGVMPSDPTTDIQRIAVAKAGGEGINWVIDEHEFVKSLRGGKPIAYEEGDVLYSLVIEDPKVCLYEMKHGPMLAIGAVILMSSCSAGGRATETLPTPSVAATGRAADVGRAPLACSNEEMESYINNLAGGPPPNAGSPTPEEAVRTEADRILQAYDFGVVGGGDPDTDESSGSHVRYAIMRDGKTIAFFRTVQLSTGRYAISGGELCSDERKPGS